MVQEERKEEELGLVCENGKKLNKKYLNSATLRTIHSNKLCLETKCQS